MFNIVTTTKNEKKNTKLTCYKLTVSVRFCPITMGCNKIKYVKEEAITLTEHM